MKLASRGGKPRSAASLEGSWEVVPSMAVVSQTVPCLAMIFFSVNGLLVAMVVRSVVFSVGF